MRETTNRPRNTESGAVAIDPVPTPAAASDPIVEGRLAEIRRRLEAEAGLISDPVRQYRRAAEALFTADQRGTTTILFGGLTWRHDALIRSGLEGLGYRCEALPVPDVRAFQTGKEFGNNGQCNPTYFTVGNLVRYLQARESEGMSREEIRDRYVFFTAGACGPCRFGMYESEYRLALRNSGFDGFRVLIFQQSGGLNQAEVQAGLDMNLDFFLSILNALSIGDLLNEVAYQIRPYEIQEGETDRVMQEVLADLAEAMRSKKPFRLEGRFGRAAGSIPGTGSVLEYGGALLEAAKGEHFTRALRAARERIDAIPVDRLRVKPIVKVTGEFWAQTTEGDGNYRMFSFLEREGAQVLVEPIATWIAYMIHGAQNKLRDRKGLEDDLVVPDWRQPWKRLRAEATAAQKVRRLDLARSLFVRQYETYRRALGGTAHALADQLELERAAHPLYNSRAGGGEGHLEVAKNIYYHHHDLCHMVLSLKPFGCMPSTQSDGVQSAVISRFPDMIYLPIETSGEGEVNAHSRVQMALGEARMKARAEFARALASTGYTIEQLRAFVDGRPDLTRAGTRVGHHKGFSGVAASFVLDLAPRMRAAGIEPQARVAGAGSESAGGETAAHGPARPDAGAEEPVEVRS